MRKKRSCKIQSVLSLIAVACFVTFANSCAKSDDITGNGGGYAGKSSTSDGAIVLGKEIADLYNNNITGYTLQEIQDSKQGRVSTCSTQKNYTTSS